MIDEVAGKGCNNKMRIQKYVLTTIISIILVGCAVPLTSASQPLISQGIVSESGFRSDTSITPTQQEKAKVESENTDLLTIEASPTPSPTPTQDPFSSLYDCQMEINFISGPLDNKSTEFTVLGMDYFEDKADKFSPGQGTGIFYETQRYFIIHSAYQNGNILRPMEAEFIRKYLEYWGGTGNQYIQGQIDTLIGSQVIWSCDGEQTFTTEIGGILRLSHEASDRLWLNPNHLQQIISEKEGEASEWIGDISGNPDQSIYLSFCGWGPEALGSERYTQFRYLIQFKVLN